MGTKKIRPQNGEWTFNETVAESFSTIARGHIPNYEKVIDKCIQVTDAAFNANKRIKVIDVGSATGHTMDAFIQRGYTDVWGVESSPQMRARSLHRDRVILSDSLPKAYGPFHVIVANWTLHFVHEREAYMRSMYESLTPDGICIISDKMLTSQFLVNRYHDFKRSQGVSDEEIAKKAAMIRGVLVPLPLEWYLRTLRTVGFKTVEVFDADWCFASILCAK